MKALKFLSVVLFTGAAFATPSVTLDRVQQRYPWNGLVDIDYTVSGVEGNALDYSLTVTWANGGDSVVSTNFDEIASCDLPTENGTHRVTWNAAADGLDFLSKGFSVGVKLDYAPITEAEADYLIVDVSSGKDSATYPVRYAKTGAGYSTANFNHHVYKQTKIVLKKVKAGEFWMGGGNVASGTGLTRHRVRLSKDYWLGIFEFTRRQIKLVTDKNATTEYSNDSATELANERPECRINIDTLWHPSNGVFAKLNARAKQGDAVLGSFVLPSEAQWEYACRAGTETKYYWGTDSDANLGDYAWYSGNAQSLTHAVGLKLPNNWGFYDMAGNVGEWCRDWSYLYPFYSPTEVSVDPVGTRWTRTKVLRGGSYHPSFGGTGNFASGAREMGQTTPECTSGGYNPNYATMFGFRLAKELGTSGEPVAAATVASDSVANLAVDFSADTVRTITTTANLLPVAYWSGYTVTETSCTGDNAADPTGWTDSATVPVGSPAGQEGTVTWEPTAQSLYRLELRNGNDVIDSAYFNLKNCQELTGKSDISGFTATLSAIEFECDGLEKTPSVTVTDGNGTPLVAGTDYIVSYSSNVNRGTATVTIAGAGNYEGVIEKTFTIKPFTPVASESSSRAGGAFDTRADLKYSTRLEVLPIAFNSVKGWPAGGDTNITARVTAAKVIEGIVDEATRITLIENVGEGVQAAWKRGEGIWQFRLEAVNGNKVTVLEERRITIANPVKFVIIFK